MRNELEKIKENLMSFFWTEDLHYGLEELDDEDVKEIVESMNDDEIALKVNRKRHQQDYIADYLKYLWNISEIAFWRHIDMLFYDNDEFLSSDNMFFYEQLCQEKIPSKTLALAIDYLRNFETMNSYEYGNLSEIIKNQVENYQRLDEVKLIVSTYTGHDLNFMKLKLTEILDTEI
ncbi:hypothetical protein [Arcobacter sp. L]|uniref:hypothetical protein n=1 Tax=Arcobacter sp. L TaxID=944547 RepID=UPI000229658B|nr:hypothetical protein [Arcobacter sp. L]BAK73251.1 conserved hypothetical protein [Arcobacter sp. L]